MRPARFFPVEPGPYRMRPGLLRWGVDFGNGVQDQVLFSHDDETERLLAEKLQVLRRRPQAFGVTDSPDELPVLEHFHTWLALNADRAKQRAGLRREPIAERAASRSFEARLGELLSQVAEDVVLLRRVAAGESAVILHHVCFPSGWRPERLMGASFLQLHEPVPGFEFLQARARALVEAMFTRGPYVRFVWTITSDPELDRHPSQPRGAWQLELERCFFRVERQITVPLVAVGAAVFIIRTYVQPLSELSADERERLAQALELMASEIADYKGLADVRVALAALLRG